MRAVLIYVSCIFGYDVATYIAYYLKHLFVGVHCVLKVVGCIVKFVGIGEVTLLELHDAPHHRVI